MMPLTENEQIVTSESSPLTSSFGFDVPLLMSEEDYDQNLLSLRAIKKEFQSHHQCLEKNSVPWWFTQGIIRRLDELIRYMEVHSK